MKHTIYTVLSLLLLSTCGCKKFLAIEIAPDLIETEAVFQSDATAISAINGLYVRLRENNSVATNSGLSIYTSLSADDLYPTAPSEAAEAFWQNQLTPQLVAVSSSFYNLYKIIYSCNSIVEGLAKSIHLTDTIKTQLEGEATLVRALCYFYLVQLFGDVPLVTSTEYTANAVMPRTESTIVKEQIVADLIHAQNLLKPTYPITGKIRPNKWTATALLARVYLYQQNWEAAAAQASLIIASGQYSLSTNLNTVFLINSTETIWEIASDKANTAEGGIFIPSSSTVRPTYVITQQLLSAFEPTDVRQTAWLKSSVVSGVSYRYPFKYKERNATTGIKEYNIVFRLSEQYLIRAEALAHLNNLDGARADVNAIRSRVGLSHTTATDQSSILQAIDQENRIEFFAEWGHRWLDLIRTSKAADVLAPIKGSNWQNTDLLYPIPFTEIQYNPYLVQNPGYE